jgi:hypothetical protein
MDRIVVHSKDISTDGLSTGIVEASQRRPGSRVTYDTWLMQGCVGDDTQYFISEDEIASFIKFLTEAKEKIKIHRTESKSGGQ